VTPTSEEPPPEEPDRDFSDRAADGADAAPRGWIHPDDRLWRHPSELSGRPGIAPPGPGAPGHHSRIMVLIGAGAALAAVAWIIILLSPASDHPASLTSANSALDSPQTTLAGQSDAVPGAAETASHSMVELRAETDHGTVSLVGVAVAEGGLVATTADGLKGLRHLFMVGSGGHLWPASVAGVDDSSDLALVDVPDDVPVPTFADDATLDSGSADMTLSMAASGGTSSTLRCTRGSVTAVGMSVSSGPAQGMPAIVSSTPAPGTESGDPLLNQAGSVIGILYSGGATPTFLPSQLVLGVTDDLRSSQRVAPGWLGIKGYSAPGAAGAMVASVTAGGPAAGRLHPGEIIAQVDSVPVQTMADLRGALYVLAPHTTVALSVVDGTTTQLVDVTLGASP
jgi:S1-C subfamily serine protease